MRSLLLDELTPREAAAARDWLAARAEFSGVEGLYWLRLPRGLWADRQRQAHAGGIPGAGSFRMAVEAGPAQVRFELLVRAETLDNPGGGQATAGQTLFILEWADRMARELGLLTCADSPPAATKAVTAALEEKA
jgi:microcystin degradation protein MlrC